jgi:hypothetical protein
MPTTYDYEFIDGFDKYGPPGMSYPSFQNLMIQGEWTSLDSAAAIVTPPDNSRGGAFCLSQGGINIAGLKKTLSNRYARCIGGMSITYNFGASIFGAGFALYANGIPTIQFGVNHIGQLVVWRGANFSFIGTVFTSTTLLYTSLESIGILSSHYIEWDIKVHPSDGWIKLWLDGVLTTIDFTGINTSGMGTDYYNGIALIQDQGGPFNTYGGSYSTFDHLYTWHYLSPVGTDTPLLTNPIIETHTPNGDSAVAFTPEKKVLGEAYAYSGGYDNLNANTLALMKFIPTTDMTIHSVSFLSTVTNGIAKFKSVLYSDDGNPLPSYSLPLNRLSDGTEKIGINGNIIQTMDLATPTALTAGTPYWIGFYSDTAMNLRRFNDSDFSGCQKANTYGSGAPATITGSSLGSRPWMIYGNCTGMSNNYTQVNDDLLNPPLGDIEYNDSNNAGDEDLFTFPPLAANTANVYTCAVKAYMRRAEAGYRLMDVRMKSVTTDSAGSAPAQAPPASYGWVSSYFDVDPNTSSPWTPSGLNAALSGYKINA